MATVTKTLGFAVLGLLAKQPRTGYEISRAMQRPLGYFWSAGHSQIYPELADLEADRLVRSTVIPGPGPRDTKRYAITARGSSSLTTWLKSPLPPESHKDELMLRIWSLWLLSPDDARTLVNEVRAEHLAALDAYAFEEQQFMHGEERITDPTAHAFGEYATLRYGLLRRRASVEWCDWLLTRLSRHGGETT